MFSRLLTFPLAAVLLMFSSASDAAVLLDRVVAVVNQEVVTWSELYREMESDASPQMRELKDEALKKKIYKENEAGYLETLINMKLQIQEAYTLGMGVSEDEVREAIDNIKKKYGMTDAQLKESLKREGFTESEYRKKLKEQILAGKVVNQQVRSKIVASEEEIRKIMDELRASPDSQGGYRLSMILLKRPKSGDAAAVEKKASEIMDKLKSGAGFEELARTFSEDSSAGSGGELGFIKKEYLAKEFLQALSSLKQGEVGAPFWTERGLHIVRLDAKVDPKSETELKEEARSRVVGKLFNERYNAWIKTLREKSFIDIRL